MMNLNLLEGLAFSFYLASSYSLLADINENQHKKRALILAWIAALAHLSAVVMDIKNSQGLDFSFFHTASFIALIITSLIILAAFSKPVEKLGIALFPIAALMLALDYIFPNPVQMHQEYSSEMKAHILSSIIAFSLLTIAAVQALLLTLQNKQLRNHHPGRFILALPPLQAMESLLFQIISTGLFFLSVSLLSGFLFIDDLFAQHLAHKTLFSILAWIMFAGLLIGRSRYGWRGKIAVRWTLYGFVSLLLAYFGSRIVLELILDKV